MKAAVLHKASSPPRTPLSTRRQVAHDVVSAGSFTDPEYASVGWTEAQARERYDCAVAVVGYGHLFRAVIDGHTEGLQAPASTSASTASNSSLATGRPRWSAREPHESSS
jgi:hypothetical protein